MKKNVLRVKSELREVKVILYNNTFFYNGLPFVRIRGYRHPSLDMIFITAPRYLKHELFALASRIIGIEDEPHCHNESCFCSSEIKQTPKTELCDFHKRFFKEKKLAKRFKFSLTFNIFCEENIKNLLEQKLRHYSQEFTEQTGILAKIKCFQKKESLETPFWLVATNKGYSHHPFKTNSTRGQQVDYISKTSKDRIEKTFLVLVEE